MENYFEKAREQFFNKYSYSQSNVEFINAYCDAIRYNLNRCGIRKIDGKKIKTTRRTSNSFMVLYDAYLMFIITVIYDGNRIRFGTKWFRRRLGTYGSGLFLCLQLLYLPI